MLFSEISPFFAANFYLCLIEIIGTIPESSSCSNCLSLDQLPKSAFKVLVANGLGLILKNRIS